jgi:hypothetical protein
MAALGARMLARPMSGVESAEALAIKRSSETSSLGKVADAVSTALRECLDIAAEWLGLNEQVDFALSKEFITDALDSAMVGQLLAAVNGGALSLDSFIATMQRAGYVPAGGTVDDEKERIDNRPPLALPTPSFGFGR